MDNRELLINQLADNIQLKKEEETSNDQYISATGTLEADSEKTLENLAKVEKKEEDPWSRLNLNPVNIR